MCDTIPSATKSSRGITASVSIETEDSIRIAKTALAAFLRKQVENESTPVAARVRQIAEAFERETWADSTH